MKSCARSKAAAIETAASRAPRAPTSKRRSSERVQQRQARAAGHDGERRPPVRSPPGSARGTGRPRPCQYTAWSMSSPRSLMLSASAGSLQQRFRALPTDILVGHGCMAPGVNTGGLRAVAPRCEDWRPARRALAQPGTIRRPRGTPEALSGSGSADRHLAVLASHVGGRMDAGCSTPGLEVGSGRALPALGRHVLRIPFLAVAAHDHEPVTHLGGGHHYPVGLGFTSPGILRDAERGPVIAYWSGHRIVEAQLMMRLDWAFVEGRALATGRVGVSPPGSSRSPAPGLRPEG